MPLFLDGSKSGAFFWWEQELCVFWVGARVVLLLRGSKSSDFLGESKSGAFFGWEQE